MTLPVTLVTGANGFVGQALCDALASNGCQLRRAIRGVTLDESASSPIQISTTSVGMLGPGTRWENALSGINCVVHLAARAHVMRENSPDALAEYRTVNVLATEKLARDAVACGVRRLVFLSSIKVNGERTLDHPFNEHSQTRPEDAYGISKFEAEQSLWRIAAGTGLEVVVLRAPLIYGPGVKGNFLRLMNLAMQGMPLPLGSIQNLRSLIFVGNLVEAIVACVKTPLANNKTFLLSDGRDVSTPELLRCIADAMRVSCRLYRCPLPLLKAGARVLGKGQELARLTGSLRIDSSRIQRDLGWKPRFTLEEGLATTAQWYYSRSSGTSDIK